MARLAALTLALLLAAALAAPAGAATVSRQRAAVIAERAAGTRALASVVIQGPAKPLRRRGWVSDAGPGKGQQRTARAVPGAEATTILSRWKAPRLRRAAWLIWIDRAPYARYEHPSTALLVDVRSGRVVRRLDLAWWPLVNGRTPAFVQPAGYARAPYLIAARGLPTAARRQVTVTPKPVALAPGLDLSRECFVAIGDRTDPGFAPDFTAIHALGAQLGVRHVDAYGADSLRQQLEQLTNPLQATPCDDVVLFLNGHGMPPFGEAPPPGFRANFQWGEPAITLHGEGALKLIPGSRSVEVIDRQPVFDLQQLEGVLQDFPRTGFKVLIDACYSGQWQAPLQAEPNVRVVAVAASSTEPAKNWRYPASYPQPGAFTYGGTKGILTWATSPDAVRQTGPDLGKGIVFAYSGTDVDVLEGVTHPPPLFDGTDRPIYGQLPQQPAPSSSQTVSGQVLKRGHVHVTMYADIVDRQWGSGTVDIEPGTVHCGVGYTSVENCYGEAPFGQTITMTAKPGPKTTFGRWVGKPCEGQGATCSFTADGDYDVELHFTYTG